MKKPINHVKTHGFIIKDFKLPLGSIYGFDYRGDFICTSFKGHDGKIAVFRYVQHTGTTFFYWKKFYYKVASPLHYMILEYIRKNDLSEPTHFLPPIRKKDIRTVTPKDRKASVNYDGTSIWCQRQIDGNVTYNDRSVVNETAYWQTFKK